MTPEEAIDCLKRVNEYRKERTVLKMLNISDRDGMAFGMAIDALEKQTPKKPVKDDRYISHICPVCNWFLYNAFDYDKKPNYCRNCSQRIDWGGEE